MTREMTGAEMVIQALADQGVEHIFGYPGGAVLPIYDAHVPAGQGAAHPGAPRAGRGACGRRLCALDRQGRLRAGDLRSGRDQCGHRPDRRADGFDPDRLHHRAGADAPDRQRRVPGMRHGRHHPALHQAQLSGEAHRGSAARAARGVLHRASGRPGPGGGRYPEGHPVRQGHLFRARRNIQHKTYQPAAQGRHRTRSSRRSS